MLILRRWKQRWKKGCYRCGDVGVDFRIVPIILMFFLVLSVIDSQIRLRRNEHAAAFQGYLITDFGNNRRFTGARRTLNQQQVRSGKCSLHSGDLATITCACDHRQFLCYNATN